ncbi:MAG: cyclase family protein [Chloroflexota bacterium]
MSPEIPRGWLEGCYIKADASNLVDLTHDWHEGMSQPSFFPPMIHELHANYEENGALAYYNHLLEECGTHCEAAAHMLPGSPTIEQVPLKDLIGPAVVIDIRDKCRRDPDYRLDRGDLEAWEAKHGRIPDGAWLVMSSGWSDLWDTPAFFGVDAAGKTHYPGFDPAAMRWLVETDRHIIGIATECMSPEGGSAGRPPISGKVSRTECIPVRDELLPVWHTLVIEDLANAHLLPEAGSWLVVGVIPFRGGSAGQSRIFGVLP